MRESSDNDVIALDTCDRFTNKMSKLEAEVYVCNLRPNLHQTAFLVDKMGKKYLRYQEENHGAAQVTFK